MTLRLSIAIPLYNEEAGIPELLRRVCAMLDGLPDARNHEVMLVDDGSSDRTLEVLEQAAAKDSRLVIVSLSRNFGHQAAFTAALDHVTGDVVVLMDGDLQDPPEVIPKFLEQHALGFDVVYAQRAARKEAWYLRAAYFLFYRLLDRLSSVRVPLDSGDFGLMSRRVVDEIRKVPEKNRFLRGLRTWVGFKQIAVVVERSERHAGESKYSFRKLLQLAFDGIFAFSTVPIRAAAVLGAASIGAAVLFAAYTVWAKLFMDDDPKGFTALTLLITFLSGMNLFFVGVIGEYIGRIYEETKGRPAYIVGKLIRHSGTGNDGNRARPHE